MVIASTMFVVHGGWQTAQLNLATERINNPQHVFQPQSGFACLKVDDKSHTDPGCKGELGLC
jgi:hypothetical protein